MFSKLQETWEIIDTYIEKNLMDVIATLLILLVLLFGGNEWYFNIPVTVVCLVGLIFFNARNNAFYWFILAMFVLIRNINEWETIDNHKYLLFYMLLFQWILLLIDEPERKAALIKQARLIIGFCMLFSVTAKLIAPDYLNESFFTYTLITDDRFAYFTHFLGGISLDDLSMNQAYMQEIQKSMLTTAPAPALELFITDKVSHLALFMTWWTVIIESIIAVLFLTNFRFSRTLRNPMLLLFCWTTYAVATVVGFAWALIILGISQVEDQQRFYRVAFLVTALIVYLYTIPFGDIHNAIRIVYG